MQNLTMAHDELFRRRADESYPTLQALWEKCDQDYRQSKTHWPTIGELKAEGTENWFGLRVFDKPLNLNEWSFTQLCKLASVNKDTVNRLQPSTASQVFQDTLSDRQTPIQVYANQDMAHSIHGATYTRLYNVDLLTMVREFAVDFQPAQQAGNESDSDVIPSGTGLYCGEQDMFCFLIDPTGWAEINDQAFAPGFFIWNSEVGRRSVGVQTFWFQAICQNHIVWDAVEVVNYSRKHTTNVRDSISEIRSIIERLVETRDARRDGFVEVVRKAMRTSLGQSSDDALEKLVQSGFTKKLADKAIEIARQKGALTIFTIVDALTRLAGKIPNAGDRSEMDQKASSLLALVN